MREANPSVANPYTPPRPEQTLDFSSTPRHLPSPQLRQNVQPCLGRFAGMAKHLAKRAWPIMARSGPFMNGCVVPTCGPHLAAQT